MVLDFSSLSADTSNALTRRLRKFLHERANQIKKDIDSYWPDGADDSNRLKLIQDREAILRLLKEME